MASRGLRHSADDPSSALTSSSDQRGLLQLGEHRFVEIHLAVRGTYDLRNLVASSLHCRIARLSVGSCLPDRADEDAPRLSVGTDQHSAESVLCSERGYGVADDVGDLIDFVRRALQVVDPDNVIRLWRRRSLLKNLFEAVDLADRQASFTCCLGP